MNSHTPPPTAAVPAPGTHRAVTSPGARHLWPLVTIACSAVSACDLFSSRSDAPGADSANSQAQSAASAQNPITPGIPAELEAQGAPEPASTEPEPAVPHPGPFFAATSSSVGIYSDTSFNRRAKIGYMRRGSKTGVSAEVIKKSNCEGGWYQVLSGGYVCGNYGTINLEDPKVKFGTTAPDLNDVLPYRYGRNAKNGTPLYKSVPTREQIARYEPYLESERAERAQKAKAQALKEPGGSAQAVTADTRRSPAAAGAPALGAPSPKDALRQKDVDGKDVDGNDVDGNDVDGGVTDRSWWQRDDADDHLHKVSLKDLAADADDILAQRMVKGFYVAIDKVFKWNDRTWYKTTKGLVAPSDRFWQTEASDFKGTTLDASVKLPLGFVFGWQKERPKYQIDPETKAVKADGAVKHFQSIPLTGDSLEVRGTTYVAAADGYWLKKDHVRVTEPGPMPADLAVGERWIDVDLSSQTVVAFEGTTPVYATLISSGKESTVKEKDHRTPRGEWRVREKHIATTMDGDGSVAGDLPYSIEDVPYVMYFEKSYALHGAFWHRNYGTRMSHGCINLSPLDAKYLFFFSSPQVPEGWHGAWSTEEHPGTRIVVHD